MTNYFWFGYDLGDFMIPGLHIHTVAGFIGLCVGIFIIGLLLEKIKIYHELRKYHLILPNQTFFGCFSENSSLLEEGEPQVRREERPISQLIWFIMQTLSSYFLMLSIMTFNGYIGIVVILGCGLGYFLFSLEMEKTMFRYIFRGVFCDGKNQPCGSDNFDVTNINDRTALSVNENCLCNSTESDSSPFPDRIMTTVEVHA